MSKPLKELLERWDNEDGYMAEKDSAGEEMARRLRALDEYLEQCSRHGFQFSHRSVRRIIEGETNG